ncbi:MAG: hypothetical protein OEY59_03660 [Deltaproteobacteria bacterium]|nr:hypothetical protein [Deltaproteobacteria bacterium]
MPNQEKDLKKSTSPANKTEIDLKRQPVMVNEKSALRFDITGDYELTGNENDVMWILKEQAKKHFFDYFGNSGDEMVPAMMWFEEPYLYVSNFGDYMEDMDLLKKTAKEHIEKNQITECIFACEVEEEIEEDKSFNALLTISYQNPKVFGAFCFKINDVDGKRELEQYEAERLFYQCEQYLNFFSTFDKENQ